nr:MAG TPA: hypothetical protein [Caudoviricetes sp.]
MFHSADGTTVWQLISNVTPKDTVPLTRCPTGLVPGNGEGVSGVER